MSISRLSNPGVQPRVLNQPWAKVSGGTVTSYTAADGSSMEVHTFTANGTLTVDVAGVAEVFMIGGGGGWDSNFGVAGGGGGYQKGIFALPAGANSVTVGAGGPSSGVSWAAFGKASKIGSIVTATSVVPLQGAGDTDLNQSKAVFSSIRGTSESFGATYTETSTTGKGDGARTNTSGAAGIVIVAVQTQPPTKSGVVATGGTVTNYTGDGTNGVLGQPYTVHTFTSSSNLVVTQGGEADILVCGAGGGPRTLASYLVSGGGATPMERKWTLSAGTFPAVIGAGGVASSTDTTTVGGASTFAGLTAYGSGFGSGAGATSSNADGGFSSSITGSALTFGRAAQASPRANSGDGGAYSGSVTGATGVVIVRYKTV